MAKQQEKKPALVRVEVTRAFYYGGQRRDIGAVIEMAEVDYLQWRQSQKVKLVIPPAVQEPADPPKAASKSQKKEEKETK